MTTGRILVQVVVLIIFFTPFSYYMDVLMYRQVPQAHRRSAPAARARPEAEGLSLAEVALAGPGGE